MKRQIKNILTVSKTAFNKWWAKDPFKESAAIAYYAINPQSTLRSSCYSVSHHIAKPMLAVRCLFSIEVWVTYFFKYIEKPKLLSLISLSLNSV